MKNNRKQQPYETCCGGACGKRRLVPALLCLLLVGSLLGFVGCTSSQGSADVPMQTVTDMQGRQVEIPADPQRVACIYASAAHMMAMLDETDRIVAVPGNFKSDALMQRKIQDLDRLSVPKQDGDINVEELMGIRADLILLRRDQLPGEGQEEKLAQAGIPWVIVDYENLDQLWQCIALMGRIFGEEEKAADYTAFAQETIEEVQERVEAVAAEGDQQRPRIYHSVNEAIRTDAAGSLCAQIMEKAGVADISTEQGLSRDGNKTYATIEEIYNWDPDGIIANESSVTDYILSDGKWSGLRAVKDGAVYTLPVGATRWCHPGSMEAHMGVLAVAWRFYPAAFEDFDLAQFTRDYYRNYFGLQLDDETIGKILAGEGMRKSNEAERK